ncbi:MAG: hypothetical protein LUI06_03670 [Ruminococcus sp.]|nr:hypothetical protein [Ruminococcus sp.]
MKAIILCTTECEGLLPINEHIPTSAVSLVGQTPASMAVDMLKRAGISEIHAVSKRLSERYSAYFKSIDGVSFSTIDDDLAKYLVSLADDDGLLLVDASSALMLDLSGLIHAFESHDCKAVIGVVKPSNELMGSRVRISDGYIDELITDEYSHIGGYDGIFTGVAVVSKELLQEASQHEYFSLLDMLSFAVSEGESIRTVFCEGFFKSLQSPDAYRMACLEMTAKAMLPNGTITLSQGIYSQQECSFSGITLIPPVFIGKGARLEKGCIVENSVIEANAVIGKRASVRGCVVGESAVIGTSAKANDSVICAAAKIGSATRICSGCSLGERAVVGVGAELAQGSCVFGSKRVAMGDYYGSDSIEMIDEDGCCSFSSVFSPAEAARFGMAVASAMNEGESAVCGCGEGDGAMALLTAFESGIASAGVTVINVGASTEQEIMYLIGRLDARIGCCVNAGICERIKLISKGGLPLEGELFSSIERISSLKRYRQEPFDRYGRCLEFSDSKRLYEAFLSKQLPRRFRGVNADVRCSVKRYAQLADELFRPLNDLDGERIIFHISNDGTTCTAYTDSTGYVINERLVLLALKSAFERNIPVALPFTFPMAADKIAEQMSGQLYRYFHSSYNDGDFAARNIASRDDNLFVRDGVALMCLICSYLSLKKMTLGEAIEDLPEFYSSQRFAAVDGSENDIYKALDCKQEGGEGIVLTNGDSRVMVRPLSHRHGLIIFTESVNAEMASSLCDDIVMKLKLNDKHENNA